LTVISLINILLIKVDNSINQCKISNEQCKISKLIKVEMKRTNNFTMLIIHLAFCHENFFARSGMIAYTLNIEDAGQS